MPLVEQPEITARLLGAAFGTMPFSTQDARSCDVSRGELRATLRRGLVTRLGRGVYIETRSLGHWESPRQALVLKSLVFVLNNPNCAISHEAAAAILGLPCPRGDGRWNQCEASVSGSTVCARHMGRLHVYERPIVEVEREPDLHVLTTTPTRTAFDVAACRPLAEGLIVVDAVARRMLGTEDRRRLQAPTAVSSVREALTAAGRDLHPYLGYERAQNTVGLANPAAESPAESYSRGCIIESELPNPTVSFEVIADDNRRYFSDFAWEEFGVLGEVDGRAKYATADDLRREKSREDALRRSGWRVVRWWGWEIVQEPQMVIARIARTLNDT